MAVHTVLSLQARIKAISRLSDIISDKLNNYEAELKPVFTGAYIANPWFTERFVRQALSQWAEALTQTDTWIGRYGNLHPPKSLTVGVVNAGNIPFVGLHDLISILISGHKYQGKNATGDGILLPFIAGLIVEAEPALRDHITFAERLSGVDAVIATGSNNSARYFEYYFGKYPNIIRMNRNGVAVLTGDETKDELVALGKDIFTYFGLGCRNVSKLYVPEGYNFNQFFEAIFEYSFVNESSKYMNNFDYNNSVLLLKQIPFLQNGFLIVREEKHIASSIAVVHYEKYESPARLEEHLAQEREMIQCIAAGHSLYEHNKELKNITVPFGKTQSPELWDYADGVDTIKFLSGLN